MRVEMFNACAGGAAVGVAVAFGVAVAVAVGLAVAVAVGLAVAVAVGLAVAVGFTVAVAVAVAVGVGLGGWVGTIMPWENSEVFPAGSMAVAVTIRPLATVEPRGRLNGALPLPPVVTLRKPRNSCPSAGRASGSVSLAKNSRRNVVFAKLPTDAGDVCRASTRYCTR